jgi:crotonobetainyl-CoA:carnitine CoA-transferase CaiB-like acyl-CoA transferase
MTRSLPLDGLRVLDMSHILAGPFTAQVLGDLGAEVLKVEKPGGDGSRIYGPPFLKDREGCDTDASAMFLSANRNKRSIVVDIRSAGGCELIREFAAVSDIMIENYRVGALDKLGLAYRDLRKVNPRLIYCSITGFGQTGPLSTRPGFDAIFQALSGLMSVTGEADDKPGGGPMKVGPSIADIIGGLYSAIAILGAVQSRERSGEGCHIDMSLLDCTLASLSHCAQQYLMSGEAPPRRGTEGNGGMPTRVFRCRDREVFLSAGTDHQFQSICEVLGIPHVADDPRFATNVLRVANRAALVEVLEPAFATQTAAEVVQRASAAGVPIAPVNTLAETFAEPQIVHRGMKAVVDHLQAGALDILASPIRYDCMDLSRYRAPPVVGQHSREVLADVLAKDAAEIATLFRSGVVAGKD